MGSKSDFGRDYGLIHQAVLTSRRANWGQDEWGKFAHSEPRMREFREVLLGNASIVTNTTVSQKSPKLLKRVGHYSAVRLTERHDPDAYYQTREGLYVTDDFRNNIVAAAKPSDAGAKWKKIPRYELVQSATGTNLKTARPRSVWAAHEFCPWLSAKLAKQKKGEAGEFLNNGWANLFLVEGVGGGVFLVRVDWDVVEWRVLTWPLGSGWGAGRRFGSRN